MPIGARHWDAGSAAEVIADGGWENNLFYAGPLAIAPA
jgi:hypothetical protein